MSTVLDWTGRAFESYTGRILKFIRICLLRCSISHTHEINHYCKDLGKWPVELPLSVEHLQAYEESVSVNGYNA